HKAGCRAASLRGRGCEPCACFSPKWAGLSSGALPGVNVGYRGHWPTFVLPTAVAQEARNRFTVVLEHDPDGGTVTTDHVPARECAHGFGLAKHRCWVIPSSEHRCVPRSLATHNCRLRLRRRLYRPISPITP